MAIFARLPIPGKAKTRLVPMLGARGSAELHAALLADTIQKVNKAAGDFSSYFFLDGRSFPVSSSFAGYSLRRQRGRDLGERLRTAFLQLLRRHAEAVVIGTDSPALPPRVLRQAFRELQVCDAVLGPCPDGGFYLIGLRRVRAGRNPATVASVFRNVPWGSAFAFRSVLRNLAAQGLSCSVLEPYGDIDRPRDVISLKMRLGRSRAARQLAASAWRFLKSAQT